MVQSVRNGSSSIMLWTCFIAGGQRKKTNEDQEDYVNFPILE